MLHSYSTNSPTLHCNSPLFWPILGVRALRQPRRLLARPAFARHAGPGQRFFHFSYKMDLTCIEMCIGSTTIYVTNILTPGAPDTHPTRAHARARGAQGPHQARSVCVCACVCVCVRVCVVCIVRVCAGIRSRHQGRLHTCDAHTGAPGVLGVCTGCYRWHRGRAGGGTDSLRRGI
jgi:hypothetical protein